MISVINAKVLCSHNPFRFHYLPRVLQVDLQVGISVIVTPNCDGITQSISTWILALFDFGQWRKKHHSHQEQTISINIKLKMINKLPESSPAA
ncbi:hypothetical protein chiPu_0018430 [Chiloscyllium punctatum]|uniref:Uncharacterized protein n=1 Tax=Chiloscyllium punctatum TaxID=137246 RepID=A0A401RNA1_CHIPU|nr:hypothetical protein [Chiloscyllium punctatum]